MTTRLNKRAAALMAIAADSFVEHRTGCMGGALCADCREIARLSARGFLTEVARFDRHADDVRTRFRPTDAGRAALDARGVQP